MENSADHFAIDMSLPHLVVVTCPIMLETADPSITTIVARGIYTFSSYKVARAFATQLNDEVTDNPVAFRFKRCNLEDDDNG